MATVTNLIVIKPPANPITTKTFSSNFNPQLLSLNPPKALPKNPQTKTAVNFIPRATAADPASTVKNKLVVDDFDEALRKAKNKLVVVEYAAIRNKQSSQIYPFMVELSRTCSDVEFLLVMVDESPETRELCKREKIEKVPHFSFYKSMEKIHDEEGIGPDQLIGDVLYYGGNHSGVVQSYTTEMMWRN